MATMARSGQRMGARVRRVFVDSEHSVGARARARRWNMVKQLFPDLATMTVVDLGGTVEAWLRAPIRPKRVTVVNLFEPGETEENWLTPVSGDACDARNVLKELHINQQFDLVFSNSLMEHVGGHKQRMDFAAEVRALGRRHRVQTPYRYFPVEPHWVFPLMQFLPIAVRSRIAFKWPLVHSRPDSLSEALSSVQWTELLSRTEMGAYFPDSQILSESFFGLAKSLIAVKTT